MLPHREHIRNIVTNVLQHIHKVQSDYYLHFTSNTWFRYRNMFDYCDPIPEQHRFYPVMLVTREWLELWGIHPPIYLN